MMPLHVTHTHEPSSLSAMEHTPPLSSSAAVPPTTTAQSEHGGARVRVPPPLVYLALTVVGGALAAATGLLAFGLPLWARLPAGTAVALVGLAILLAARAWFSKTGQHPAPWKPSPELLVGGIYRRTRNPMYLGLTLFQTGLGIALDNGSIVALAPAALLIVHFTAVLPEEAYLAEKFGDGYLRYKAAVRRYV
jgi:protein-S-isoprenylcysteine O-methyltransferase Ste14